MASPILTRSRTVEVTDDVGHTGLVTEEGGKVDGLSFVILREGLALSAVPGGPLAGQESQGTGTGVFELTVRLWVIDKID